MSVCQASIVKSQDQAGYSIKERLPTEDSGYLTLHRRDFAPLLSWPVPVDLELGMKIATTHDVFEKPCCGRNRHAETKTIDSEHESNHPDRVPVCSWKRLRVLTAVVGQL